MSDRETTASNNDGMKGWLADTRVLGRWQSGVRFAVVRSLESGALGVDRTSLEAEHLTAVIDIEGILQSSRQPGGTLVSQAKIHLEQILGSRYTVNTTLHNHTNMHVHLVDKESRRDISKPSAGIHQ